jgi:hypothetical protein
MRFVVPAVLILVALIHALPLVGALSTERLASLYGVSVAEPNLEILMRHRAVLFGMLAAFLAFCAVRSELHRLGVAAGLASVVSFLVLAYSVGGYNDSLSRVVRADILALVLLAIGAVVLVVRKGGPDPSDSQRQ